MSANRLLNAADFKKWERANGAAIQAERERAHLVILDEVVRRALEARQTGTDLGEIGDVMLVNFAYGMRGGVLRLPAGVERALREIGWRPKSERSHGESR
jgi:hypothetical protein